MAGTAGESLSKVINSLSAGLGTLQLNVNTVLWGRGNKQPIATVKYNTASGSLQYTSTPPPATKPPTTAAGTLIGTGLFNALDALNQVDLCNIITYTASSIHTKKKPRPPKEQWSLAEKRLYQLQDLAGEVVVAIDKYTAYPNVFIGSYAGIGPNAMPPEQVIAVSGTPNNSSNITGTAVQKYNIYNLLKSIQDTFSAGGKNSIISAEDAQALSAVPGIAGNLNIINDFIAGINKYSDYRNISTSDLRKIEQEITKIRSICIVIQNLDLQKGLALVGNFLGIDIRSQIQQLNKFIDPTKIVPTLKELNTALQGFQGMLQQIQGTLRTAQLLLKIGIIFIRVFDFLIVFFHLLPAPNLFTTVGIQATIDSAKQKAKEQSDSVTTLLSQIDGLLEVLLVFIRYLSTNLNELLSRLQILLLNLQSCEAVKNSDVLNQLQGTVQNLINLKAQLDDYITKFDTSANSTDSATFGDFTIRVVDEEVVDKSIRNKRRRGIALDKNGAVVIQSDLTFATDTNVIINEVKLKLISSGLVKASTPVALNTMLQKAQRYLIDNEVPINDLKLEFFSVDPPNNENENEGLGLNAYINQLPGGKRLRRRARRQMAAQKREAAATLAADTPKLAMQFTRGAAMDEIDQLKANIEVQEEEIALLLLTCIPLPNPASLALIEVKREDIVASNNRIAELEKFLGT
jgi:hypothetical protein